MPELTQDEMDAIMAKSMDVVSGLESQKSTQKQSGAFEGFGSMASGMNPAYFLAAGEASNSSTKKEPTSSQQKKDTDQYSLSEEENDFYKRMGNAAHLIEEPAAKKTVIASEFPTIDAARDLVTHGIESVADYFSFEKPKPVVSDIAQHLHTLSPSALTQEIKDEAAKETDPEKLKQFPEWFPLTNAQHKAVFDQKHADTTLAEDAKSAFNLGVGMAKGFGELATHFVAGAAKAPVMVMEGPGAYGSITDPEEWKRWGTNLGKLATVPAVTALESGESVVATGHNALANGLSATDWIQQKLPKELGGISHDEAFDRYLRRKRANEYYAGWKVNDPNVFTRVVMEDPYARQAAENILYAATSVWSPSVEDRLDRHNGNRDAALQEKRLDDLKQSSELLSQFRKDVAQMVPDKDITEAVEFTPFGLNPFDIYGKALSAGLGVAGKASRVAKILGKSGSEVAAMDAAAAKAAYEAELKAAKNAMQPGWVEQGAGKLANAIDFTGEKVAGALESIPAPVKTAGAALGGGLIGLAQTPEDRAKGFAMGAGTALLGRAAMQAPRLVEAGLAGRRMAAGGGKSAAGLSAVVEKADELGVSPKVTSWMADKGLPAAKALDWMADNTLDMARGSVHGATLALAVGVLENKDPEQVADLMGQGVFMHAGGYVMGNMAGVTHDRWESNLKRQRAGAAKFVNSLDPQTKEHIDKLSNWETYASSMEGLVSNAAQDHGNAQTAYINLANSGASPEKLQNAEDNVNRAARILDIRKTQLKNVQNSGVETAKMYGDQVRIGLADLMNSLNGSMTPGKNVELKIQTGQELLDDVKSFNKDKMLTPLEEFELENAVAHRAGQRAFIDTNGGQLRLSSGKVVSLSDPSKSRIGVNIDKINERLFGGESVLSAVAHEAGHAFFDTKQFREENAEVINKLFGNQIFDAQGNLITGEAGLFSKEDLVERFNRYYANGTNGGWEGFAAGLGLYDPTTKDLKPDETAKYMREEVMAELIRGASQGGINLGVDPKPWLAPLVDWMTIKNRNSATSKAVREFVGIKGDKPWSSSLVGTTFSAADVAATKKALKAVADLRGDVSAATIIPHKPISESELRKNAAVADQFKDLFATEKVAMIVDAEGKPLIDHTTGQPIPAIPLSDQNVFEGTWEHGESDKGDSTLHHVSGYGEYPQELNDKFGHIVVPQGGKVVVSSRIKRTPSGALQMLTPQEVRRLNRERGNILRGAIEGATDREYPGRLSATSTDGLSYSGRLSPEQVKIIKRLPESIIPFDLKSRILEFNRLLVNDQGEGMIGLYGQATDKNGKYKSFAPKIVDFVPMGLKLSKDGNILFTLFSKSGMDEKLRRWQKDSPELLNLWNGDKDAFTSDLRKVLNNWKPTEANPSGLPGETGLDPDRAIAISKKNRINDFLNIFRKTEPASLEANPARTKFKRPARRLSKEEKGDEESSDPNTLVRSYRVDRFHDLAVSSDEPLRVNYGKALYNAMPEGAAEPERERRPLGIDPALLRGLSALRKPEAAPVNAPLGDNRKNVGVRFMPADDYRGEHKAPDEESGAPFHEVTKDIYPPDFYKLNYDTALQYYGSGDTQSDSESLAAIRAAQGKPNARVKVYRAVPKFAETIDPAVAAERKAEFKKYLKLYSLNTWSEDFKQKMEQARSALPQEITSINAGDWVTPSKTYAVDHGESALNGEYKILSKTVPASHLHTEGNSLSEFGYNPPKAAGAEVRFMPDNFSEMEGELKPVPTQEELDAMKAKLPAHSSKIKESQGRFGTTYKIDLFDDNANLAGFAYAHTDSEKPNILHIEATHVDGDYRGKGYGQALYREIAKLAQNLDIRYLTAMSTSRLAANTRAKILQTKWKGAGWNAESKVPAGIRFMPEREEDPTMVAPGFYSKAGRVLLDKMPNRASAEQLKGILDPQKGSGVKPNEMKRSGIVPFIDSMQAERGFVTKDDVKQFLKDSYAAKFETQTMKDGEKYTVTYSDGNYDVFSSKEEAEKAKERGIENHIEFLQDNNFYKVGLDENENWVIYDEYGDKVNFLNPVKGELSQVISQPDEYYNSKKEAENALNEVHGAIAEDNVKISESEDGQTQYSQYTLPGGKNYEETVLRMPGVDYTSSHFQNVPNYVAHMRTADHGTGRLIEELQSDAHQKARDVGYYNPAEKEIINKKIKETEQKLVNLEKEERNLVESGKMSYSKTYEYQNRHNELKSELQDLENSLDRFVGIPDMPFKKDWPLQLFKHALQKAVADGKEWIGWTGGEAQADRYSLSKHVSAIDLINDGDGKYHVTAYQNTDESALPRSVINKPGLSAQEVADTIGKPLAEKLIADLNSQSDPVTAYAKAEGLDLNVGGEGMKGFYDTILPNEIGKYVKQWGEMVVPSEVEGKKEYVIQGNPNISPTMTFTYRDNAIAALYNRGRGEGGEVVEIGENPKIWKVAITPEMRSSVEGGQPRFMPDAEHAAAHKAGDEENGREMVRQAAEQAGYTRNAKHGTTHKFTAFNLSRSNPENDMGKGFYFSTSPQDVESNYARKGPDLTNRIERLAEEIYNNWDNEGEIDAKGGEDAAMRNARQEAERSLSGGEQRVIDAYLNLKKPLIIGGKEGTEFEAKFESEESEPTGSIMELVESVQNKADEYQAPYEAQDAISKLMELGMDYGTVSAREAVDIIKKAFENVYDPDTGDTAVNEFTREVFKDAGFDGIVDNTVNEKFGTRRRYGKGMEGMGEDTQHIIAFNPESIKSADPFTYDNAGKLIPLSERFNPASSDIRFMPEKSEDEAVRLANSTARASATEGALSGVRFMPLGEEAQASLSPEEKQRYANFEKATAVPAQISKPDSKYDDLRVGTALLGTKAKPLETPQTSNISGAIVPDVLLATQLGKMNYPHLPEDVLNETNPRVKRDKMVAFMKDNLKALYDAFPAKLRARATLWYDGARKLADGLSGQHQDLTPEQSAGILAVFSPQKDWFMNVAQGYQCVDIYKNEQDTVISRDIAKKEIEGIIAAAQAPQKQKLKAPKGKKETPRQKTIRRNKNKALDEKARNDRRKILEQLYDRRLADLSDGTKAGDILEAWGIRILAQIKHGRTYKNISPEGNFLGNAKNANGKNSTNTWGSTGEIRKAVSIMKNGSLKNISGKLGDEHKVRNFYNNIIAPNTPFGDATIDTHAVAAAHLMPYGSSAKPVTHNFGGSGKSGPLGISGSYHVYMDAYQQLAKELGILPRQLQSITWEAIRELYPSEKRSPKLVKEATEIWKKNNENDARQYILRNGISAPVWARTAND